MTAAAGVLMLAFVGWLVGLQAVEVRRDAPPARPPVVWIVTAVLGLAATAMMTPHMLQLLT